MTILEIFEKVNLVIPIEQRVFFNFFEDTVNELQSLYGDFVFIQDKKAGPENGNSYIISVDANGNKYLDGIIRDDSIVVNDSKKVSDVSYTPPKSLNDDNVVLPLYHNAIVDNILFLANKGEQYKGEFIRKSRDAYLKYWNDNAKGRRVRRMRW